MKSSDSNFTKEKKLRARAEWVRILTKTRVLDADPQRQLDRNKTNICEIHFKEHIIRRKSVFNKIEESHLRPGDPDRVKKLVYVCNGVSIKLQNTLIYVIIFLFVHAC